MKKFTAHGKLLLSAEYFVLDGATALALPTRPGQTLQIESQPSAHSRLHWRSLDDTGQLWFNAIFDTTDFQVIHTSRPALADTLSSILNAVRKQKPTFLLDEPGLEVITDLQFPRSWGLGSSSTLISNMARWAGIDSFQLQFDTFGGSAYDIACATADGPLLYRLTSNGPQLERVAFRPPFHKHLYFVYLGQKQDSRAGIRLFESQPKRSLFAEDITAITYEMVRADTLSAFQSLMQQHEKLISQTIGLPPVQQQRFADFPGAIKSLGAWGGDFVLAACDEPEAAVRQYFGQHELEVCLAYEGLVL